MKKILIILLIIIELFIIKIPSYVELNDLAIIEKIAVIDNDNSYTIILKEIIPVKDDQGISYKYHYYQETAKTIEEAYNKIDNSTNKKLYLNKVKSLITNMATTTDIRSYLNIKPHTIRHTTENIEDLIKK